MPRKPSCREPNSKPSLPLDRSVGYQIRMTHRLVQRTLQTRIEQSGVTLGMWYFLRVLWDGDGLTQSELSRRIGTMEPTTLSAIAGMEQAGIVRRERDASDRRKIKVFLTEKGRGLEAALLPAGIETVARAVRSLSAAERDALLGMLATIQRDLSADLAEEDG